MTTYFVTGNANKFHEVSAIVPGLKQLDLDLDEIQSLDSRTVIEHKLEQAAAKLDGEFIVEDTALKLVCLGGLPGTLIKWFEQAMGIEGIAALAMKHEDRSAEAITTIGYRDKAGKNHFFVGRLDGEVVPPRGTNKWGWNPIFVPKGEGRTFAELTPEEKNRLSMRGIAARKLAAHLAQHS